MSGRRRLGLPTAAIASVAILAVPATPPAAAVPPPPAELRVDGGAEAWHPENRFTLRWTIPSAALPVAAVHYQVRDSQEAIVIGERRIAAPVETIGGLSVPARGAYTAEVWLEDPLGGQGGPAAAALRFDDGRPGDLERMPASAWIGRTAFPYALLLGHPVGPAPISGIRGYAVAIDTNPRGEPCEAASRCTDAETDLRGGVGEDRLAITQLPEGVNYVHAAAVSGSGVRSAATGQAVLRVDETDPVTRLSGAAERWTRGPAVTLEATAVDELSGMGGGEAGVAPFTAIEVDGGPPTLNWGSTARATVIGEGLHRIAYYARDAAGNVNDGSGANGIQNRPPSIAEVGIDRERPRVAFANHQDPSDPELIVARVVDPLSGADRSRGSIAVRRAGSDDHFTALATEPGPGGIEARWDSDAFPRGEYEFQATGYDAAGNAATTGRRLDGARMSLRNPLKAPTTLRAGLAGGDSERSVRFGSGASFGGRLTVGVRTPLAGAPVRIVERFSAGAGTRASVAWTDGDGRFSVALAPGPSRQVSAAFAGTPTLARSLGRPAQLLVRSGVRLCASAHVAAVGGRPLVFRGRVAANPGEIPANGKELELQFRLRRSRWSEFRTIRTDAEGRFRYAYRFSDDDSRGIRFEFRAYAPAQGGWPYEPAGSRPVAVRGG